MFPYAEKDRTLAALTANAKVAAVALARKTAGILFAMLRDEAPFKARGPRS